MQDLILDLEADVGRRGTILAGIGTAVLWLLLCLLVFLLPSRPPKKHYEEIKITLSSSSAPAAAPRAPAPAQAQRGERTARADVPAAASAPAAAGSPTGTQAAPAASPAPAPAVKKPAASEVKAASPKTSAPKSSAPKAASKPAAPKAAASKPAAAQTPAKPFKPALDLSDGDFDFGSNTKTSDFDESAFASSTVQTSSRQPENTRTQTQKIDNALKGSAASTAESSAAGAKSSVSAAGTKKGSGTSGDTMSSLARIRSASYSSGSGGVESQTVVSEAGGTGGQGSANQGIAMQMSDGATRRLLNPEKPVIKLSEEAAALIDTSKEVSVQFIVKAGGNVPLSGIEVTPAASLPAAVLQEIRTQVSFWRFEPGSGDNTARFAYRIIKK